MNASSKGFHWISSDSIEFRAISMDLKLKRKLHLAFSPQIQSRFFGAFSSSDNFLTPSQTALIKIRIIGTTRKFGKIRSGFIRSRHNIRFFFGGFSFGIFAQTKALQKDKIFFFDTKFKLNFYLLPLYLFIFFFAEHQTNCGYLKAAQSRLPNNIWLAAENI